MCNVRWPKVLDYNNFDQRPLVQWIDLGNHTMFRLTAFFIHGGFKYPRPGLFVGVERIGCFLFALDHRISYQYVMDKLFLPESDARAIADWMNVQLGHDGVNQGWYCEEIIKEVKEYGLGGENKIMPLVPEIINNKEDNT